MEILTSDSKGLSSKEAFKCVLSVDSLAKRGF